MCFYVLVQYNPACEKLFFESRYQQKNLGPRIFSINLFCKDKQTETFDTARFWISRRPEALPFVTRRPVKLCLRGPHKDTRTNGHRLIFPAALCVGPMNPLPINVRQIIRRTLCFGCKILKIFFGTCLVRISAWPSAVLTPFFSLFSSVLSVLSG